MPMWHHPDSPAADRARELHTRLTGAQPQAVASAPATWNVIGEHVDYYGGVTVIGLVDLRAAVAVSPRTDDVIRVTIAENNEETTEDSSLEALAALAAAQQPTTDSEGRTIVPPAPTGSTHTRVAGMVWMLINRQLLSRETSGMDITVVSDIPPHAGLGARSAMDVATALTLIGDHEELADAPMRARIADVCAQAVTLFSEVPPLRARHTAALRGAAETVSVIDYADNSVTQAPHPLGKEMSGFVVSVPAAGDIAASVAHIRARQRFIHDACHAFGTDSLRLLPDAAPRVVDWLTAVHEIDGPEGQPTLPDARNWLAFFDDETTRAQGVARSLRSRRGTELFSVLGSSQTELAAVYGLDNAQQLAELSVLRGAVGTRAASAGIANAIVAYVPAVKADHFADDLSEAGLNVITLHPGEPARPE